MTTVKKLGLSALGGLVWFAAWAILNLKTEGLLIPLNREGVVALETASRFGGWSMWPALLATIGLPWLLSRLPEAPFRRLAVRAGVVFLLPAPACLLLALCHPGAGAAAAVLYATAAAASLLSQWLILRLSRAGPIPSEATGQPG